MKQINLFLVILLTLFLFYCSSTVVVVFLLKQAEIICGNKVRNLKFLKSFLGCTSTPPCAMTRTKKNKPVVLLTQTIGLLLGARLLRLLHHLFLFSIVSSTDEVLLVGSNYLLLYRATFVSIIVSIKNRSSC